MRPGHDQDHWITRWIRNNMESPLERDEKARMWLLKVQNGATEL
jgi:phage/plasmid-associated DNA primase